MRAGNQSKHCFCPYSKNLAKTGQVMGNKTFYADALKLLTQFSHKKAIVISLNKCLAACPDILLERNI